MGGVRSGWVGCVSLRGVPVVSVLEFDGLVASALSCLDEEQIAAIRDLPLRKLLQDCD